MYIKIKFLIFFYILFFIIGGRGINYKRKITNIKLPLGKGKSLSNINFYIWIYLSFIKNVISLYVSFIKNINEIILYFFVQDIENNNHW